MDIGIIVPWPQWMSMFHGHRGILWDQGFIPESAVAMIVHHAPNGAPPQQPEGNVVTFPGRKP